MSSVSPTKAQVLQLFQRHEKQLVTALSSTDLLKLSNDLLKNKIISKEMRDIFASLDHDRLEPELRARYLLRHVLQRIECGSVMYNNLVSALSSTGGCVKQLVRVLNRELGGSLDPAISASGGGSIRLEEHDIPALLECIIDISPKWNKLGIALRLPRRILAKCMNGTSDDDDRLDRVLTHWVTGSYEKVKEATLMNLKSALESVLVGEGRIARDLEDNYKEAIKSNTCPHDECVESGPLPFRIVYESSDTEVADHKSALLEVQVSPSESVSYQWMKDGRPLSDRSDFSGTCREILLINQASLGAEGEYYCQVSCGSQQLSSTPATITVIYPPDKECLISLYSSLSEVPNDSWPLGSKTTFIDIILVQTQKYTNVFIEEEMEALLCDKERIEYKDAFSQYECRALVLVEGRPGSGKTTLANKIAKDWAEGKVLKNTDRVFLISLRKDQLKSDLLKKFYHSQSEEFMLNLEQSHGEKTCFILDGYDEFSLKDNDSSIIYQLIHKTYLPHAMIIITSRPTATATVELRQKATTTIESLGFTKDHFDLYINSYPFEDANDTNEAEATKSKLRKYLKACTNVLNMCYLPINASIICFLFNQGLGDSQLPKTETQIYEKFVIAIILRKLQLHSSSVHLRSLKDLGGENNECFKKICSLAFDMTVENKQVVHQLPMPLDSLNETPFRGLLATDCIAKEYGLEDVVTFLHLTLQEYLAAYHLASLNDDQQTEIIARYGAKSHMLTTFKFYCGLVCFDSKMTQFIDIITKTDHNNLFLAHCIYENQQPQLCSKGIELMQGVINLKYCILTPADCIALGYVVSNASELITTINIQACQLYEHSINKMWNGNRPLLDHGIQSLSSGLVDMFNAMSNLMFMNISYKMSDQHSQSLLKIKACQTYLYYYRGNRDDAKVCRWDWDVNNCIVLNSSSAQPLLKALMQCHNLTCLEVVDNVSGVGSTSIIENILTRNTLFKTITIRHGLKPASIAIFAETLRSCEHLQILNLESNNLNSKEGANLLKSLKYCTCLQTLVLLSCEIGPQNAKALAYGINELPLKKVELRGNDIGPEGALALDIECCFKNTNCLNISHNAIGSEGAIALSNILGKSRQNINDLMLAGNLIDSTGMAALAKELKECRQLQHINLTLNPLGSDGAAALANCLINCFFLKQLIIWGCNITSDGITALDHAFFSWKGLTLLDLTDNKLCSKGMPTLAKGINFFCNLEQLYLSHNQIDWRGAKLLAESLQSCPMLSIFNISHNNIGSIGATAIADKLLCTNIKFVNLSHNSFGPGNEVLLASLVKLARRGHPELLDLAHNDMGTDSTVCLIIHLIFCNYPMKLNLSANNTSPEVAQFLTDLKKIPIKLTIYNKN